MEPDKNLALTSACAKALASILNHSAVDAVALTVGISFREGEPDENGQVGLSCQAVTIAVSAQHAEAHREQMLSAVRAQPKTGEKA
jgi:hypothetical protein